jgi:anti-sigma factor RsiW
MKRKFKRKLTPFLCHEMLYDYAAGSLDEERRQAVDEFLKTDAEGQRLLESVKRGMGYLESLSQTGLKPEALAQLMDSESALSLGRKYSSWRQWPETLRWSITAIIISASVASVVAAVPWGSFNLFKPKKAQDTVELAQIPNGGIVNLEPANPSQAHEAPNEEESEIGVPPSELPGSLPHPGQSAKQVAVRGDGEEEDVPIDEEESHPASGAKHQAPAPTPAAKVAAAAALPIEATEAIEDKKEAKPKGFVYRAFMSLHELDTVGPKITDEVRGLGGEKAGEVELGWKRGTGRYYHFALPEANEERLMEKLRAYGPVRISKDPHPRIMPRGQVRFILWIESSD